MANPEETLDEIPSSLLEAAMASIVFPVQVDFGALSHPGKVRTNNEDQYFVMRRSRTRRLVLTSLPRELFPQTEEESYTMIVADGMGGAAFGEVASEMALRKAWELGSQDAIWPRQINGEEAERLLRESRDYIQLIHQVLQQVAQDHPEFAGMGTTLTAAYTIGMDAFIVHVGDSRAYLVRGNGIRQITRDHTLAQHLVDSGVEAAQTTAYQHVLINCLGGDASEVTSEVHHVRLLDGDHLLLCTDGLSDLVRDQEMVDAVRAARQPQDACDRLVSLALDRGGKDNITVLVARYTPS